MPNYFHNRDLTVTLLPSPSDRDMQETNREIKREQDRQEKRKRQKMRENSNQEKGRVKRNN